MLTSAMYYSAFACKRTIFALLVLTIKNAFPKLFSCCSLARTLQRREWQHWTQRVRVQKFKASSFRTRFWPFYQILSAPYSPPFWDRATIKNHFSVLERIASYWKQQIGRVNIGHHQSSADDDDNVVNGTNTMGGQDEPRCNNTMPYPQKHKQSDVSAIVNEIWPVMPFS